MRRKYLGLKENPPVIFSDEESMRFYREDVLHTNPNGTAKYRPQNKIKRNRAKRGMSEAEKQVSH